MDDAVSIYSAFAQPLKLVDRTGLGGKIGPSLGEILVDQQRIVYKPGETWKYVARPLIEWLFLRTEQQKVWTTEGAFVQRFAVESPPPDLVASLGEEVGDCSPITIDTRRLEHSDTSSFVRPTRMDVQHITVPTNELREKQGASDRVGVN